MNTIPTTPARSGYALRAGVAILAAVAASLALAETVPRAGGAIAAAACLALVLDTARRLRTLGVARPALVFTALPFVEGVAAWWATGRGLHERPAATSFAVWTFLLWGVIGVAALAARRGRVPPAPHRHDVVADEPGIAVSHGEPVDATPGLAHGGETARGPTIARGTAA